MNTPEYRERLVNLLPRSDEPHRDTAPLPRGVPSDMQGHRAVVNKNGRRIQLARTLGRPMRYFLAKRFDGPYLIVAERIDEIRRFAVGHGLGEQFHPAYTRMVPAHYVVDIELTGCPDPNPNYRRFFSPPRDSNPPDVETIGRRYIEATAAAIRAWLQRQPANEPVGVAFSGGIDSTAVLLLTRQALRDLGREDAGLRAFTLAFGPDAADARQAADVVRAIGLADCHEIIAGDDADLDPTKIIRIVEDYRPLDLQCAAMNVALLAGIRRRYAGWRVILDGDGGDENLKDYPLEGTDITITSVLNNPLLYHEGWGVESIKHSLTYSGGLSRSYTRTLMPQRLLGFSGFSPFTVPSVIATSEGIPFVELTNHDVDRLYALKGEVVAAGIRAVVGIDMPVHQKRRFQEGTLSPRELEERIPLDKARYRRLFDQLWRSTDREANVHVGA